MTRQQLHGRLTLALFVALGTPWLAHGETIGAPVVFRPNTTDNLFGSINVLNSGFTVPGTLSTWEFFNLSPGQNGRRVTPLILDVVAGNYIITGVGTTRASVFSYVPQVFDFGLTSGSDAVGPGSLFGWKDGTDAVGDQGAIEWSFVSVPAAGTQQFLGSGHSGDLFPGSNLGPGVVEAHRDYSVQATSVPEPASLILMGLGLGALGFYAKGRRSKNKG